MSYSTPPSPSTVPSPLINPSPPPKHGDVFLDSLRPGLRLLGILNPVQDRVTISAVERLERGPEAGLGGQNDLELRGHPNGSLRRVVGMPSTIDLGRFDLAKAGGPNPLRGHERGGFAAIDLRPFAPGATRGESLEPRRVVD